MRLEAMSTLMTTTLKVTTLRVTTLKMSTLKRLAVEANSETSNSNGTWNSKEIAFGPDSNAESSPGTNNKIILVEGGSFFLQRNLES